MIFCSSNLWKHESVVDPILMIVNQGELCMSKFLIECPNCGTLNRASNFIFAKKAIQCGNCKQTIDVKANRLTSKKCPHCKNVVVYDQAKKTHVCPACHEEMGVGAGKLASFQCPQCSCIIQVDENTSSTTCPVCDYQIENVEKEVKKAHAAISSKISVIKYEGDNETFVWKYPIEDFTMGSQLIVHESQEAIFFLDGQALDTFGPGRYSLETENLPMLKKIYTFPTDQQLFHAEVYFVNKTVQLGIKWGTDSRVRFIEPNTGIPLDIGASGEMYLQVKNARKLLIKLVGTTGGLKQSDILHSEQGIGDLSDPLATTKSRDAEIDKYNNGWTSALKGFFRPVIMTAVKSNLASAIKTNNINILEIDEKLEVLSNTLREQVTIGFGEYGLFVPQFYVTNVSLPEDDKNFIKIKDLLAATYLGVKEAEVQANIIAAQRRAELEKETTLREKAKIEAERLQIEATGEATAAKIRGLTEAEVMAAQGYTKKDIIQADVQKAYAEGIGNMGGNGGDGGAASDILGIGIGLAAANLAGSQLGAIVPPFGPSETTVPPAFKSDTNTWTCACSQVNTGKFCSACGQPKPEVWVCESCGHGGNIGKFCSECGRSRAVKSGWDCSCGQKDNTGNFCSNCGKSKEVTTNE